MYDDVYPYTWMDDGDADDPGYFDDWGNWHPTNEDEDEDEDEDEEA